jgi:hypothetical protein
MQTIYSETGLQQPIDSDLFYLWSTANYLGKRLKWLREEKGLVKKYTEDEESKHRWGIYESAMDELVNIFITANRFNPFALGLLPIPPPIQPGA